MILNTWIPNDGKFPEYIDQYMLTIFDEYVDESGVGTCSIKFKFTRGEVKGWYHPPKLKIRRAGKSFHWRVEKEE